MNKNSSRFQAKISRSKFLRWFVLGGSSAAILVACGSNPTDSQSNSASPESSSGSPSASSQEPLVVGTEGTYPPFSFKDLQTGDLTGYDIDIAKEVANRLGREVEFVATQWKSMLASLESKRFDFVANQVTVTPEREQQFLFSEPYTVSGAVVLVSDSNPKNIQGIADLKGKVVGTTQGSNFAEAAIEAGAEIKYYPGAAQVLTDLELNRVDAALNDRLFALTELKKANYNVETVGEPFSKESTAFAFHKDNNQLRDAVNQALADMKKDGTLANISEKWFGEDVSS